MALKNLTDLTTQKHKKKSSKKYTFPVLSSVILFSSLLQFQLFNGVGATTATGESNLEKEKGTKSNGESIQFSPSLFDSLPFNGAFVTGKDSNIASLNRNSGLKRVKIKVRNSSHFNGSISLSSPTVLKNRNKNVKNTTRETTTTTVEPVKMDMDMEKEKASSLFDLLPNQGAMIATETTGSTSHDQGDKNPNPRNQRSPLKLNKRFDASFRGGFEIEPQNPTSEFSLSFFNENVLPPIIKTLTQDDNPEITRLSPPVEIIKGGGGYSSSHSSSYQPPPTFIRQPYQNPQQQQQQQNTHYKVATAIRETSSVGHYKKPNVGAAASSGGSTVIIYANPQSPPTSSSSSSSLPPAPPPIRNSYGIPPPFFTTTTATTTTATPLPKNEIHYHYHINTNDDKLKTTTTTTSPPTIYGKPIGFIAPPPPRNFYRAPVRNRKPNFGYGLPPPPPPSRNTYLPPSKNTGGYSTPESQQQQQQQQQGGYSNSGNQQTQEETSGGYSSSSSSSSSTFNNHKNSFHNDNQQLVPIITGGGNSGRRGNSKKNQNNLGLLNLDYTNDEGDNVDDDYDDEKFRSRTLFTINKFQEREPSNPSSSNPSFPPTPSQTYGPPPPPLSSSSSSGSSSSYGPPAPPQYGPPSSPAPPPPLNNDNPSQTQSAQTSITLETIPITTTETRFVTVPKITQTLGGTLQQNLQNPPPNDAPSGGYSGGGSSSSSSFIEPPAAPNRNNNNNNNNNLLAALNQNQRNILNEQLLQLSPSRGGLPDFSDIETLALLQAQNNPRNSNPHLLSELLLSQITNGNNNHNNNNNNNFRGSSAGSNLFLNSHQTSADLRTLSLLNSPLGIGSGIRTHFGHQPQPFSISPAHNNVPILNPTSTGGGGLLGAGQLQSLRGGSTVLTGDAVGAISDLIREQRLQLAVSDLRSRLRNQHRDADRTRTNYRNLFYKGALLLAGLSLIPTVSTVVSPGLAAAATLGAGSSAFSLSSSLLPLTTGRRRRDVHGDDIQVDGSTVMSMEKIFRGDNFHGQFSSEVTTPNIQNTNNDNNRTTKKSSIGQQKLTNMTNIDSLLQAKRTLRKKYTNNNLEKVKGNSNMVVKVTTTTTTKQSLFDNMPFKGAFIPLQVGENLEKYLPLKEIMKNSQCLQKYFCENLLQIETFPDPTPILLLYAGLSSDVDKNPWLREAMTAAKNQNCAAFYCYQDVQNKHPFLFNKTM